ncbi:HEPN domain-containing protein [Algoriphagus sp. D3-2-R+10]|uniref:HEPN domain-containing protein n=1 Tax=Algoriphagus aurantiacus TaxID=3103948 RepID=UPI002B3758CE|nr:HEPN domain-containing protein [Algoriphagus sp. D3-2-R+10]MEB2774995.1 HEPN domain-containing protein [Algoriphagus sp. D3-2-R+10]
MGQNHFTSNEARKELLSNLFAEFGEETGVKLQLWSLFKSWTSDPDAEKDLNKRKGMIRFYENLQSLVDALYQADPLPDPEPFPELIETSENYFLHLIEALKILVDPELIFLFDLPNLGHLDVSHRREIYVVLKNQDLEEHRNTIGLFSFLTSGRQEFAIHSINRNHLNNVLGKGHLFFQYHIRQLHLIYRKEGVPDLIELPHERLQERMLHLRASLEKNWEKADLFWRHALQEQENFNWESSLFFLHQALELRLRALILVWEKRELKSHETRVLLRECYQFIPELASVFPQDTEEEVQLLQMLEDAYCKARYRTEFPVEEQLSRTLSSRVAQVRELCNKHYEYFFQSL